MAKHQLDQHVGTSSTTWQQAFDNNEHRGMKCYLDCQDYNEIRFQTRLGHDSSNSLSLTGITRQTLCNSCDKPKLGVLSKNVVHTKCHRNERNSKPGFYQNKK